MSSEDHNRRQEDEPLVVMIRSLRSLSVEQWNAVVQSMLSHFGAFCIGGAIAVGVYADEVAGRACGTYMLGSSPFASDYCAYLGNLSMKMQYGLAAVAVVVLLTAEWMSRRRHQQDG